VETLLTAAIPLSQNPSHHVLASRVFVRTRLQRFDEAITDGKEVLVCRSVPTYADSSAIRHGLHRRESVAGLQGEKLTVY
jgi:hypothetical protein